MGAGGHVLVVDDDGAIRMLCRINLEVEGYAVVEAASIEDARAAVGAHELAAVLLDVHVGGGDGLAFLRELRRDRPDLPVGLLTGSADSDGIRAAAPDAVLPKPFTLDHLLQTVARLSGGRR